MTAKTASVHRRRLTIDHTRVGKAGQRNGVEVSIGGLANSTARFHGDIELGRVAGVARSDDWLKAAYHNLVDPSGFVRWGREEAD